MFVRALFAATATTVIAAAATEPWHVTVAMACQGLLSGFIPAAVALTSVSVPQGRLTGALGTVQGAQYSGTTIGPAAGALIAGLIDLRGAIVVSALMPAVAAALVLRLVPRDRIEVQAQPVDAPRAGRLRELGAGFGLQFAIGLLLYFITFVMVDLVRTGAPAVIASLGGPEGATRATGIAFSVSGLASVAGALGLSRLIGRPGHLRGSLALVIGVCALAHVALGLAGSVALFIAAYGVASLARGALLPATNTIIATSVPPERRGTAFGLAAAAQATAFIVGPMAAALFATISLALGFIALGLLLAAIGAVTFVALREPRLEAGARQPDEREARRREPA
jgi:DHA1 family multidrug resistance protein-like MFS transporter